MSIYKVKGTVQPGWIDFNGHMNVGYYGVALDIAGDGFFDHLNIGESYRQANKTSFFTVESHLTYQAELMEGEPYEVEHYFLDVDPKRVHFLGILRKTDGTLSATVEWLHLHVDMTTRAVSPMADDLVARLTDLVNEHRTLLTDDSVKKAIGRTIGIRRKS